MKTAISIPDTVFRAADQYAKSHGVSRSNLFTQAVIQFLENHSIDHITEQLNEVYSNQSGKINPIVSALQFNSIEKEEW